MSDDPKARTGSKPGGAPNRLRPTVITAPVRRAKGEADITPPSGAPAGTPAMTPIVRRPTVIPGVARKRIKVGAGDMARLCPGVAPRTAAQAARLVDGFVVEGARPAHVEPWGRSAQQRGAALVCDALDLAEAGVLDQARAYRARMVELLDQIDIEAICGLRRDPPPGVQEPVGHRVDTPRQLKAARAELEQLVRLAQVVLPPLQALNDKLDDHARRIDEAGLEIEAAALAALFLSEHLGPLRPELSRLFLQREMSLTETALDIRSGQFERDSQREEPRVLVIAIREVVLAGIPDWLARMDRLVRARRGSNPTEVAELQHGLRALLRHLQA